MDSLANFPAVSTVLPSEAECALSPLVLAFANDPAVRWMYPDAHQFRIFFPRFARAFAGNAFALGTAERVGEFRGAALWLRPGVTPGACEFFALIEETVAVNRRADVHAILEKIGALRPREPHWNLLMIGIDPRHQRSGLGSTLLNPTLAACDRDRTAAYVVATNLRNAAFFARHGFKACDEIQIGTSPTLVAMVRTPS